MIYLYGNRAIIKQIDGGRYRKTDIVSYREVPLLKIDDFLESQEKVCIVWLFYEYTISGGGEPLLKYT